MVTLKDIRQAVRVIGLSGNPLCVHASLRSFGHVEGGAATVVDGLLEEGCTVMVPAWTLGFILSDPSEAAGKEFYATGAVEIDKGMGAIAADVVGRSGRIRGDHPLTSFAAIGPLAKRLMRDQAPKRPFAPLETLVEMQGQVVLMGVGLHRMTLIHLAEQRAGRPLLQRWASGQQWPEGHKAIEVLIGGCSLGFEHLRSALSWDIRLVGNSPWQVFDAGETLEAATRIIKEDPMRTHCGRSNCSRCDWIMQQPMEVLS